jgi:hypothetical protein
VLFFPAFASIPLTAFDDWRSAVGETKGFSHEEVADLNRASLHSTNHLIYPRLSLSRCPVVKRFFPVEDRYAKTKKPPQLRDGNSGRFNA